MALLFSFQSWEDRKAELEEALSLGTARVGQDLDKVAQLLEEVEDMEELEKVFKYSKVIF